VDRVVQIAPYYFRAVEKAVKKIYPTNIIFQMSWVALVLGHKLIASILVSVAASLYAWYSQSLAHRRAIADFYDRYQQFPQDDRGPPSFPLRIFAVALVATYLTLYLAERVTSAPSGHAGGGVDDGDGDGDGYTAANSSSSDSQHEDTTNKNAFDHRGGAPPTPSPPSPSPPSSSPPSSSQHPQHHYRRAIPQPPKPHRPALADAMRHIDLQAPPF
jgi:hypothetical protein